MTELDIEAIRERSQRCDRLALTRSASIDTWALAAVASATDVPLLLAEIERLRGELGHSQYVVADGVERIAGHLAEIERLRAALLEEQTVHAKTFDNFEASSESWLEERTRQLDRYARLEASNEWLSQELARTRSALGAAREHLDLRDSELVSANSQRDHARAALADALAVIASMSGEAT